MIVPNGKIIAIGGAEDKGLEVQSKLLHNNSSAFLENGILRKVVDETGGFNKRIEIITTASSIPYKVGDQYLKSFNKIGCTNIGLMHIRDKKEIDNNNLQRISECDCVMFSGGTQKRLNTVFYQTEFLDIILNRYNKEKLVVAGTSAGAMAFGNTMIYKGTASLTHLKGQVKFVEGFNLIKNIIFDSHFEKSGRFRRLAQAVALYPPCIGIGLAENTGVIIEKGINIKVIGDGQIIIIDGTEITDTNVQYIDNNYLVSIRNLKVHLCIKEDEYTINTNSNQENIIRRSLIEYETL